MPDRKDLEILREEIASLGDERKVVEDSGGTYEELPLPPDTPASANPEADAGQAEAARSSSIRKSAAAQSDEGPAKEAGEETGFSGIQLDDDFGMPTYGESGGKAEGAELPELDDILSSLQLGGYSDDDEGAAPEGAETAESFAADSSGLSAEDALAGADDFGLGPSLSGSFESETLQEQEAEKAAAEDADVISISDDLIPNLPEEGGGAANGKDGSAGDSDIAGLDFGDLDLDGLGDAGSPGADLSLDGDFVSAGDFEPADEAAGEAEAAAGGEGAEEPLPDLDLGGLGGLEAEGGASEEEPLPDLDLGGDAPQPEIQEDEEGEIPSLSVGDGPGAAESAGEEGPHDLDSFDFDEDTIRAHTGESPSRKGAAPSAGIKLPGAKAAKDAPPTELTEEEYRRFLYLLSRFPLNLRIATEEYLSEGEGTDEQKIALVRTILGGASLRKIANALEKYLDRSIAVPKDFEKKNFEEYQLEKSSLRYVLKNKILPMVSLAGIFIVLLGCVAFLSYQFIYRPVSANGIYRRGYQALEADRYSQADELFGEATERWDKKSWYFAYARGYREKNQYIAAENMYIRLLERWDNDLEGGLEYADMLRSDLQNYERAEAVLRRRVLDYHPNNLDALLLLGDVLLDWAEEDPSKYEQARLQYAMAISVYGQNDPAMSRMMRYFIRTNNLAEVLPLKERFMGKRAEISAQDLIELGGYLLEKRYMPSPGDSDALRDAIGDLRVVLEKGVDSDGTIPEGHYNMGRFWLYNYSPSRAAGCLTDAIRLFAGESRLSRRRVVSYVDSYRLLGELRASEMEYVIAQELYAKGISVYEERKAARSVPQDERIGRLYADYADIDYFISNDWDAALRNYSQAVAELCDTPSIRYKIGYIYYQGGDYDSALPQFVRSYSENSTDANILYALGNTLFRRESWNTARGYYERLMEMSEAERVRKGVILPQMRSDHGAFVEQYMRAANNLGVTLYNIAGQGRDTSLRGRAYSLFSESARAWDALTRNPDTMVRAEGTNLAYLNMQNITAPMGRYSPEIYADIPKTLAGERALQGRMD